MMSPPSADNEAIRNMTLSDDSSTTGDEGVVESSGSSDSSNTTTTPRYHYKGCHTPPKAPNQIFARSAEKIARRKGHMRWLDKHQDVKWDNTTDEMAGLDRFVIKKLRNNACEIMWQVFPMRSEGFSSATYTGQGGLVRGPDGTVKFLTAAHNTCSENDREGVWEDHSRKFRCFTFRGLSARMLEIPRAGWERTEEWSAANAHGLTRTDKEGKELTWKYGIDISLGPEISASDESAQQLLKIISVKDVVPDDFVYTTGLEIGMAVYTVDGPNYDEEMIVNRGQKGLTKEVLPDILGKAKELLIFTGRIKRFYEDHFEHDVNAFAGCSGGHLVVLQHGHPHFGKVLGVHVGSKVQIEDNIAFKVAGVFDKF